MMSRKWSGFIRCKQVANAAAFELEDALRFAAAKQRERLVIVQRKLVRIDPLAARLLDQIDRLRQNGEVAQAQKIHLQQAGALDVAHRPLRDDFCLAFHVLQRHILVDRPLGDHHGRGVRADVAREAFDLHRQVDELANFAVGFVRAAAALRSARAPRSASMPSCSGTIATI